LTPHVSVVALYGNAALQNRLLGRGCYVHYVRIDSPLGQSVLMESPLYRRDGIPAGARGCIILENVQEAGRGEALESLGGTMESTDLPLRLQNIQIALRESRCTSEAGSALSDRGDRSRSAAGRTLVQRLCGQHGMARCLDREIRTKIPHRTGGIPDVASWLPDDPANSLVFVECKGPSERIKENQEDWVFAAHARMSA